MLIGTFVRVSPVELIKTIESRVDVKNAVTTRPFPDSCGEMLAAIRPPFCNPRYFGAPNS